MDPELKNIEQRLLEIRRRLAIAEEKKGRSLGSVSVLAVSKRQQLGKILDAFDSRQRLFGESYAQEALEKLARLQEGERECGEEGREECHAQNVRNYRVWRCGDDEGCQTCLKVDFIGRLQSNKIKKLVGRFRLIHSVDRLSIAEQVAKVASKQGISQQVLLQVNVFGEETKGGFLPEEMKSVLTEVLKYKSLNVRGLMSFGKFIPESAPYEERAYEFVTMRELRDSLETSFDVKLSELSMGVSHDFDVAAGEGATIVRIGTVLFGPRE